MKVISKDGFIQYGPGYVSLKEHARIAGLGDIRGEVDEAFLVLNEAAPALVWDWGTVEWVDRIGEERDKGLSRIDPGDPATVTPVGATE